MKKSYVVLLLIIILSVVATRYSNDDAGAATANSYISDTGVSAPQVNDNDDDSWGNPNTLQDHFERHGADFDATDAQDYARQANEFYENRSQYQVKKHDGVTRVYDSETNTFGAYNSNGTTRTFYKPSDGQDYFDRQPGS